MNYTNQEKLNLFLNDSFISEFKAACEEIIEHNLIDGAVFMQISVEKILSNYPEIKNKHSEIYKFYKQYLIKLRFINLANLKDEGIFHLIKYYFDYIYLISDYDIINKIKNKLKTIYNLDERNKFKDNLRKILFESKKKITASNLKYNNLNKIPTISNWLECYRIETGKTFDKLKKAQFLTNNINVKNLSDNEKIRVRRLIDLYEYLGADSQKIENIDDTFVGILPDKDLAIFKNGGMEKIPSNIKNLAEKVFNKKGKNDKIQELKEDLKSYQPGSLEYKTIEEEIEKLMKENL